MLNALLAGDADAFARHFKQVVTNTFSYLDVGGEQPEVVYHAFVLGLLISLRETYEIKSNRESGLGRYDVMLIPRDPSRRGVIIEFKKADKGGDAGLAEAAEAALQQIEARRYAAELQARGVDGVVKIGIAFRGKDVLVQGEVGS